jgi:hypothetical protein
MQKIFGYKALSLQNDELIIFHNVAWITNRPYNTNVGLDELMKYLYQNHFKVLTYRQLGYNTKANTFYVNKFKASH